LLAFSPTAPSRAVGESRSAQVNEKELLFSRAKSDENESSIGNWKRLFFTYCQKDDGSWKPNAGELFGYLDSARAKFDQNLLAAAAHHNENKVVPLAVVGIGRAGILALQAAAEMAAEVVFLGVCPPGFAALFNRERALRAREAISRGGSRRNFNLNRIGKEKEANSSSSSRSSSSNAFPTKTKIVAVHGEQTFPLQAVYDELCLLVEQNQDLFELQDLFLRKQTSSPLDFVHRPDSLFPLASVLIEPPFNLLAPVAGGPSVLSREKHAPGWAKVVLQRYKNFLFQILAIRDQFWTKFIVF